jgi:hypothetical protein
VPFWAKDLKVGFANINAKAEGIENRPAFRARPSSGVAAWCQALTRGSARGRDFEFNGYVIMCIVPACYRGKGDSSGKTSEI